MGVTEKCEFSKFLATECSSGSLIADHSIDQVRMFNGFNDFKSLKEAVDATEITAEVAFPRCHLTANQVKICCEFLGASDVIDPTANQRLAVQSEAEAAICGVALAAQADPVCHRWLQLMVPTDLLRITDLKKVLNVWSIISLLPCVDTKLQSKIFGVDKDDVSKQKLICF